MPDKKITDLVDGGDPQATDEFVVARAGDNFKVAWSSMSNAATASNIAVTLDGNTAGALALVNTGTLTLAGGNNITVSQAGNAVTISGANIGGAQTGISGLMNSEATYTSGTVELVGTGAITIASSGGQQFVLSVDPQSVQPETQTFIAGISASDTLYTSGNVRISGSNAVTVKSGTGQLVVIDVPVQSTQPETQTFIGGLSASDTLYTSGTVRITGVGGGVTVSSNTGQRVDISVAAQSVQPETQTFVGAIVGSNATYTSGTVTFTGVGGGVTVSSNTGQRVDISVAAPVAQTNQAGSVYASSNTFGTSSGTYDARTLSIAGSGIVSVAASNSGWVISASQSANQNLSVGVSTGGNTAGNTTVNTGSRLVIVGSNGITASQGTAAGATTITLSGVTTAAQTNQSGNVYASSNTFGTSSGTYDARSISIAGSGAVGVAASNSGWVISAPTQTVQTQGVLSVGASTGGNTSGNTTVNTGSRLVFVGSNNITVSQGTAAGATTLTLSGPTTAAQTNQSGNVYASSNTFGTSSGTYDARSLSIAGSGAVSVAASNSGWVVSAPAQTTQTQGILNAGVSTGGNSSGDTGVASGTRLVFAGGNNITLSQGTAAGATTITISAPNLGAGAMSAGVSNLGNTAGSTGITGTQLVLVGSDNITLSQSTGVNGGTVSFIGGGGGGFSAGASTGGNTAGDTGITGTRMVFVGTGPVSLSQATAAAGGTLSINAPATSSLSATGQVQISTNASTISIGVPNPIQSYREPGGPLLMAATQGIGGSNANGTQTTVTAWVMPISLPNDLAFNNVFLAAHNSFSSATTSISSINYSYSMGASLGFYTLNSSSMSLVTSFSGSLGFTNATSANATDLKATANIGIGGSNQGISITGAANMTSIMSSISSVRKVGLNYSTISNTLTRGQYFAVACFSQLTGGNAQASLTSVGFVSSMSILGSAFNPPALGKSTASVTSPYPFMGQATLINDTNSLMPASFNTSKITTATAIANSTKFQSIWMQIYSSHSD